MSVLHRVAEDSPRRCQATHANLQCPFEIVEGSKFCPRHNGGGYRALQNESIRLYTNAKWQEKIGFQADHPKAKSLSEEMGILRILVETKLQACHDSTELAMQAGGIVELVREIGRLGLASHKLELSRGVLLDKNQAMDWIQEVVAIVGMYVTNPDDQKCIAEDLIASLQRKTSPKT